MTETLELIRKGALSDLEAAAELHKRQKHFTADCDLLPELRSRGIAILNTALNTDLQAALQACQPLVLLLRRTVEAVGALYLENDRRMASTCEVSDEQGSAHTQEHEVAEAMTTAIETVPEHPMELDHEELAKASKVQAAIAARRKRRALTHGKTCAKAATSGVLKPIRRAQIVKSLQSFTSTSPVSKVSIHRSTLSPSPLSLHLANKTNQRTAHSKLTPAHVATKPRLLVKLHVPRFFDQQARNADKSKRHYKGRIRTYKNKIKSEDFVHEDIQEDTAMQHIDENVETHDSPPREIPRLSQVEDSPRRSMRSSAATTTTSPTQDGTARTQPRASPTENSPYEFSTTSTNLSQTSSTSSDQSTQPSDPDASPKPTETTENITTPSSPTGHSFPPFPHLKSPRRAPFRLGASIALENILEDHAENPEDTLLELIEELEDNRPVFSKDDWEHRSVLKGGKWVYNALKKVAKDGDKDGEGKGKEGEDGGDEIVDVVKDLETWVEKEWDRIGGRKAEEEEKSMREVERVEDEDEEDETSMYVRDSE
jgi:hypothetical protein